MWGSIWYRRIQNSAASVVSAKELYPTLTAESAPNGEVSSHDSKFEPRGAEKRSRFYWLSQRTFPADTRTPSQGNAAAGAEIWLDSFMRLGQEFRPRMLSKDRSANRTLWKAE
jgi:hypothetical protein